MKIGRYIDTRYDALSCPHGEVGEAGVRCGDGLFRHQPRLLEAFHALRARRGAPIAITSGFRCAGCQARLRRSPRYRAAARSEHEYNAALDLRPWRHRSRPEGGWNEEEKKRLQEEIRRLARWLEETDPGLRIGTRLYGETHLHLGAGFLLEPNPEPLNWRPGVRW